MNIFNQPTELRAPSYSHRDMSHTNYLSCNANYLIPFFVYDTVPGDYLKGRFNFFSRVAPLAHPMFSRLDIKYFLFAVPYRLVYNDWESFISGYNQRSAMHEPDESFVQPYMTPSDIAQTLPVDPDTGQPILSTVGTLQDYLGYWPIATAAQASALAADTDTRLNVYRLRAYQLIWNEWFRDQELQDYIDFDTSGGHVTDSSEWDLLTTLRQPCWERDYFTSATKTPAIGPDVKIPVSLDSNFVNPNFSSSGQTLVRDQNGNLIRNTNNFLGLDTYGNIRSGVDAISGSGMSSVPPSFLRIDNSENLLVPTQTSSTIEDLRLAYAIQNLLDRGIYGNRYSEQILSHFGIKTSDARMQRPELLFAGKQPVQVTAITQSSATEYDAQGDTVSALGEQAGQAMSSGSSDFFEYSFEDHCVVLGLMSIQPRSIYYQGYDKHLLHEDRLDYYWPELATLGQQPIYNKELYADGNDDIFGYQMRYAEYQYHNSEIHGAFRFDNNLDDWHMARKFTSRPTLSDQFVACSPTNRVFAYTEDDADHFYINIFADIEALRPIPMNTDR